MIQKEDKKRMIRINDIQKSCENMITTDRVSTMLICFHGKKGADLYGEILNCYIDRPVWFFSLGDLIIKLDEICDWIGTPHPSTEPRFLNRKMADQYKERTKGSNKVPVKATIQLQDSTALSSRAIRARETLIVKIEYRLNSSMQGRVMGKLTNKEYVSFRSALELLRMLREIVVRAENTEL
ncbi:MAG: hypothetical protein QM683_12325 [Lacrimispora sp.]